MQVGDLVKHIDWGMLGVVSKITVNLHTCGFKNIWVLWSDGNLKNHRSGYYLRRING